MFDRIGELDWARLLGAHGTAEAFPDLLTTLQSPRSEQRQEALLTLREMLSHQDTVYEVTPFAVPFLQEILRTRAGHGALEALSLLATIHASARGVDRKHPELFASLTPQDLWRPEYAFSECDADDEEAFFEAANRFHPRWRALACKAVRWGTPTYRSFLSETDATVFRASLELLVECGSTPDAVGAIETRLAADGDPVLRSVCLHALGSLPGSGHQSLLEQALTDGSALERFVAAVALTDVARSRPGLADEIVRFVEHPDPRASELPGDNFHASAAIALAKLPCHGPVRDRALEVLVDRLATKVAPPIRVGLPLLKLAFPQAPANPTLLSKPQERLLLVLGALAWGHPAREHTFGYFAGPIEALGLAGITRGLLGFA
jgi:hypothetical protein